MSRFRRLGSFLMVAKGIVDTLPEWLCQVELFNVLPACRSIAQVDVISILDLDFRILGVNTVMERWYEHAGPIVGRACYEVYHGRGSPCDFISIHAYNRSQVLYFIAENLDARNAEFVDRLVQMTGRSRKSAQAEVDVAVQRLFSYAAWADKYGGTVQETTLRGITVAVNEPIGVIGIACPDEYPLLGFISLMAPAIARGNTVVMIPSQKYPLSATDFYQVLDTSDVPGGVVNIVTGDRDHLAKTLVQHEDVDSVWYFGSAEGSYHTEFESAANMKRTWVGGGLPRDWMDRGQGEGHEFLHEATQVKNIWVPTGE